MSQIEQLFLEAKEFLLNRSSIFTSRNLDDVEYVAHYMAKFAEQALASHATSEAAAQPTRNKQVPEETISDEIRLGKRKFCGHIAECDCQNGIFQAE